MGIALASGNNTQKGLVKSSMTLIFGFLFLTWGFLSVLNYVLLDSFKQVFLIKDTSIASLISLTFFATYLFVSLLAGNMVKSWGYKLSLIIGMYVTALGCMLLHFAVTQHNYYFFLFSFFLQALGITCLQVSANLYIIQMGDPLKAPSRLTFIQAFNSVGAVLAPVFGSKLVTDLFGFSTDEAMVWTDAQYISSITAYVQSPYILISIILFFLTIFFVFVDIPEFDSSHEEPMNLLPQTGRRRHVMHFRQLRLGAFAIFAYVGAEVALGLIIENRYGMFSAYYWMMAMIGRFIGAALLLIVPPRKLLIICGIASAILILSAIVNSGIWSIISLVAIGLFNSIMSPVIFCLGENGTGRYKPQGAAIMVMAFCGGGVISFMTENYVEGIGLEYGLIIPLVCYAYVVSYGIEGSKFRVRTDLPEQRRELL